MEHILIVELTRPPRMITPLRGIALISSKSLQQCTAVIGNNLPAATAVCRFLEPVLWMFLIYICLTPTPVREGALGSLGKN